VSFESQATGNPTIARTDEPPDFAILFGGPLFQLLRKARLTGDALERLRSFGAVWQGWQLWRALKLDELLSELMLRRRESVAWAEVVGILVTARLCEPSSELDVAEQWYRTTALEDVLGVSSEQIYDERLYRALDRVLPHREAIDKHLVVKLQWSKSSKWEDWAKLSEGTYILRSNIQDWTDEELWQTYIQLSEAEAASAFTNRSCAFVIHLLQKNQAKTR
jgi:hypothetical protein